jgi:hypothetical protein
MDLPLKAIRQQVASAINLVIQLSRLKDGSRKITSITEVVGMEGETITMQEIFRFESRGADPATGKIVGEFNPTGIRPKIIDRLFDMGVPLPPRLAQLFPDRRQLQQEALMASTHRQQGNGAATGQMPPPGYGAPPALGPPPSMPPGFGMPPGRPEPPRKGR